MSEKDTHVEKKKCISDKISHTNSVTESSKSKRRKFYFLIFVIGNVVEKESKGCKKNSVIHNFWLKNYTLVWLLYKEAKIWPKGIKITEMLFLL